VRSPPLCGIFLARTARNSLPIMHRFHGLSGVESRQWRKRVASVATSKKSYVRTVKFPLEPALEQTPSFDTIKKLYEVTEGTGTQSLFGILTATHLAGFRLFPNARQNLSFRELGALEQSFRESWSEQSTVASKLSPAALIEFAKTPRRKVKGVEKAFNLSSVSADFALKSGLTKAEQNQESLGLALLTDYVETIAKAFQTWVDLNSQAPTALELFDQIAKKHGFSLPAVGGCIDKQAPLTPPDCSIAFDPTLLRNEDLSTTDIALHQVVAQKLKILRDAGITSPKPADVQAVITTATNNALSWLFGTGFLYWQETELEQIVSDFQIPLEAKKLSISCSRYFVEHRKMNFSERPTMQISGVALAAKSTLGSQTTSLNS
jgi:hypothetical protein